MIPTPIVKVDLIDATGDYNAGCMLVKLYAQSSGVTAKKVYGNKKLQGHPGGLALFGDDVYFWSGNANGRGEWVCQKLATGEVTWREEKAREAGALTYADGSFITFGQVKGEVRSIKATPDG